MTVCVPCQRGGHSKCDGFDCMCACPFCKAYVDEHGPFAAPPDTAGAVQEGQQ